MCSKNTTFLTGNQLKSPAKKHFHKELLKNSKKNLNLEHFQKVQSILIDGNMTVEIYMESWEGSALKAQIIRGEWDGIHSY